MYTHDAAGWSIRPFSQNDRAAVFHIFRRCLKEFPWRGDWRAYQPSLQASLMAPLAQKFVAEEPSAGVVGFITLQTQSAYVDHLFVDADWRLCGVGRGLLEVAREAAGRSLSLDVDEDNHRARDAYAALGWRMVAETRLTRHGAQVRLIGP
jgi:GNAT superfamily N-acetyltransferase